MTDNREDYEAVNGRGQLVATFDNLTSARKWLWKNADRHHGLRIDAVEREVRRRTVIPAEDVGPYLKMAGGQR